MNSGTMNELVSSGNILNFKGCYQRLIFIKFEGIWNMYSNENDLSVKWEFSKYKLIDFDKNNRDMGWHFPFF